MDSSAELAGTAQAAGAADSDEALARRIAAGDLDAWDRFFECYVEWAYRFAYRHLGGNHADAQDLCSEIMMTAARSIRRFEAARGDLDAWMLGLARHRLAHFCRSRRVQMPLLPDSAAANPDPRLADTDSAHTSDLVNRALASLPRRQAAVLVGKYVAGYSVEELARRGEITPKAVESLLSRARAAFRSAFEALLADASGGDRHG